MSDGIREASEKFMIFSGMCFLELDDPGDQPSANLDFGNSLGVVGRVNGNCPSLALLRKQNTMSISCINYE